MLADALEATIAAMHLDFHAVGHRISGNPPCPVRALVRAKWGPRLLEEPALKTKHPRQALQDWTLGGAGGLLGDLKCVLPKFRVASRTGPDHNLDYVVEVTVSELKGKEGNLAARGTGSTIRDAESAASAEFLRLVKDLALSKDP